MSISNSIINDPSEKPWFDLVKLVKAALRYSKDWEGIDDVHSAIKANAIFSQAGL